MRALVLLVLLVFLSATAMASPRSGSPEKELRRREARRSTAPEPRNTAMARPSVRPEPVAPMLVEELAVVTPPDGAGAEAAGALGMLTALSASFVFARGRRLRR